MSKRRVALVTGASAGVGRATSLVLADAGFDVALVSRGRRGPRGHGRRGREAWPACADPAGRRRLVRRGGSRGIAAEEQLGPIDVWVNDAMTTTFPPVAATTPDDFRRAIDVTFLGQVWGTMAALERMRPRDRGSVVNVGSRARVHRDSPPVGVLRGQVRVPGLLRVDPGRVAARWKHVRLSMVHLPAVNTPQFDWCHTTMDRHPQPVPPIYQPEIPAKVIVQVALDGRRSKIVGTWNKLLVAAGQVAPGLGNHYAALGAWDSQLTDQPVSPARPDNLRAAADDEPGCWRSRNVRRRGRWIPRPELLEDAPRGRPDVHPRRSGRRTRPFSSTHRASMSASGERPGWWTAAVAARVGWGAGLLLVPGGVLRLMGATDVSRASRSVMRVLGLRHLVQVVAQHQHGHTAQATGIGVDALHAMTATGFACVSRRWRRVAATDAAIAACFAVTGLVGAVGRSVPELEP